MKLTANGAGVIAAVVVFIIMKRGGLGHGWWILANLAVMPLVWGFFTGMLLTIFGDDEH
jgi:predicted permease